MPLEQVVLIAGRIVPDSHIDYIISKVKCSYRIIPDNKLDQERADLKCVNWSSTSYCQQLVVNFIHKLSFRLVIPSS